MGGKTSLTEGRGRIKNVDWSRNCDFAEYRTFGNILALINLSKLSSVHFFFFDSIWLENKPRQTLTR